MGAAVTSTQSVNSLFIQLSSHPLYFLGVHSDNIHEIL